MRRIIYPKIKTSLLKKVGMDAIDGICTAICFGVVINTLVGGYRLFQLTTFKIERD